MKIYRPIKTNYRTQKWGENRACIGQGGIVVSKKTEKCPLGYFDLYKSLGLVGHNGEDWAIWHGEPVYFPVDEGEYKTKSEKDRNGGIGVDAISVNPIGDTHIKFRFWHLKEVAVPDGTIVRAGDLLGYGDSTGLSSADHLHWSRKRCDKDGNALFKDNGYYGAEDFSTDFINSFILDVLELKEKRLTLLEQCRKLLFQLQLLLLNIG